MDSKIGKVTEKRMPPNMGKGRPKGALNRTTTSAKEAIAIAADKLGGAWLVRHPSIATLGTLGR